MKKVFMIMMCLAALLVASTSVKAQEVTITLIPGWTWISCPSTEAVDFATALGDFTPMTGDAIKSQWGNAYYRNGRWAGSISQFYPGYGYKYYSNRSVPVTVTFNAQQPSSQVVVTTSEPMLITAISAMGGGEVTTTDGTYIIVKGLCWATHENPTTNDDFYQEAGSGVGSFSISMTNLSIGSTYYVRACAVTPFGTVYGEQKTFTTRDGIPEISTASVTNIVATRAICGGIVTDNGGLNVIARGVCWSVEHTPTINDDHTTDGYGLGSFVSNITGMTSETTYYVRAYASTNHGTGYGEELSFTTQSSSVGLYVDLGLPSGLRWATCNVGAETPEDYGDFFSWGETQPKNCYSEFSYIYYHILWGEEEDYSISLTKYCTDSNYGLTDNQTVLLPEDDAARANWGVGWRMPTKEEWQELYENTTCIWTTWNGVRGRLFTSTNGNSIFLPAAGYRDDYDYDWGDEGCENLVYSGSYGGYWSSSLRAVTPFYASGFYFNSGNYAMGNYYRHNGRSVRAVRPSSFVINATVNHANSGTVSGSGIYQDGQSCTVMATANSGYTFAYWEKAGVVVSTEATYSFTVNDNIDLVAVFYNDNLPTGAIDGLFSVSANQQVYFSQGNLQYMASTNTWRFAEHQYDYRGSYNYNISSTYSGWIDLFGWGTSGWNSGNTYYQPWNSNNSNGSLYGPPGQYNLTGSYANADWGVYNPISNGGNTTNQWRMLTQPEWNFVFNTRTTTSGIRYAKAKVNNVNGVILLPDDWNSSTYSLKNTNSSGANFSNNKLTTSQWNILEQAGAVFLPAAGYRNKTTVYSVGSYGYYWSASYYFSSSASDVYFRESGLGTDGNFSRYCGLSVRMVCPAE